MPKQHIFRGRFAIAFAISLLCAGVAMSIFVCLGGVPESPQGDRFFLNNHGDRVEVTRAAWIVACMCEKIILLGLLTAIMSGIGCIAQMEYREDDPRRDYSVLAMISAVFAALLPMAADILASLVL